MESKFRTARNKVRGEFGALVASNTVKMQIGVRGQKIAPDWIAIDLFDKSPLVDKNWDLQNLPLQDESVDCYVCNAILEHVPNPDLALYEMYRTLKLGGNIWVEVPFSQPYHAHPHDYLRWTLPGLKKWMTDYFREVRSDLVEGFSYEADKIYKMLLRSVGIKDINPAFNGILAELSAIEAKSKEPAVYSAVYFWGIKQEKIPDYMRQFFEQKKMALYGQPVGAG